MNAGDLLSFIRKNGEKVTLLDMLSIGIQAASGMSFLADHKIVHRDLALSMHF